MGETENEVSVNGEKNEVNPNLTPEEANIKADRVKEMDQLRMKLKTAKTKMTKNLNTPTGASTNPKILNLSKNLNLIRIKN